VSVRRVRPVNTPDGPVRRMGSDTKATNVLGNRLTGKS